MHGDKGGCSWQPRFDYPPEIEQRLDYLASQTGRTKAFYLREMIERGLEDMEDYYLGLDALERVRRGGRACVHRRRSKGKAWPGELNTWPSPSVNCVGLTGRRLSASLIT